MIIKCGLWGRDMQCAYELVKTSKREWSDVQQARMRKEDNHDVAMANTVLYDSSMHRRHFSLISELIVSIGSELKKSLGKPFSYLLSHHHMSSASYNIVVKARQDYLLLLLNLSCTRH